MLTIYNLDEGLVAIKKAIMELRPNVFGPIIVGVAGGSCSGKTTLAQKIHESFPDSAVLSMDDYYKGEAFMQSIGSDNWDEPRAVDLGLLQSHLKLLRRGWNIPKPVYSFTSGLREDYVLFKSSNLIIVEGLFALHELIVNELDLKIFVDVSLRGSLMRRLRRDVTRIGKSELAILKQFVETVYPMYQLHVEPTKALADIVVVNEYNPEIKEK